MSDQELDETITNLLSHNLVKSKKQEQKSNYYDYNPLKSSYKCYPCQVSKSYKTNTTLIKSKKKKITLQLSKQNDIIIKPWHPFLREFQKFFKNTHQTEPQNKAVLRLFESITRLREQLMEDVKILQNNNQSITKTLDTLAMYSLDDIQAEFDSSLMIEQNSKSLRSTIQEKRLQDYKDQMRVLNETIDVLEERECSSLKQQISTIVRLQKELVLSKKELSETQEHLALVQQDYEQVREQNYFLYYLVRLDRHELYRQLMQTYKPEDLSETQVSYFELYLNILEKEMAQMKLQKVKLQMNSESMEKQTQDVRKDSQLQLCSEIKSVEERYQNERSRLEFSIDQLKSELVTSQKVESEMKQLLQNMNLESEKLRQQQLYLFQNNRLFECQNGMNNVSQQNLILRQENEKLSNQIKDLADRLNVLNQSKPQISDQAAELARIILSKEKLNQQQSQLLREVFGEYGESLIEVNQNKAEDSLKELRERYDKQLQLYLNQLDAVRRQIDVHQEQQNYLNTGSQKVINPDPAEQSASLVLQNIRDILNAQQANQIRQTNFKWKDQQTQQNQHPIQQDQKNEVDLLKTMLITQAITLDNLIQLQSQDNQSEEDKEEENISQKNNINSLINQPIIEEYETDKEEDEEEQVSINSPTPYKNQDV